MRGRRVLENTGNEKRRLNPMRSQSRNRRKLIDQRRNANERSGWRIIIAAGSNERDCARVVDAIRIRVNANRIDHSCAITFIASGSYNYSPAAPLVSVPALVDQFSPVPALTPHWVESPFLVASIFE